MKCIITGGTGFIGSNLVKELVSRNVEVNLITRRGSDTSIIKSIINKLNIHEYDGSIENIFLIFNKINL